MYLRLEAKDLDYLGRGICYKDNNTYFIKNLIKGEIGDCEIEKNKKNLFFGFVKTENIIKKSPLRSKNPYMDITNLAHLKNEEQTKFQKELTIKTFNKFKLETTAIKDVVSNEKFYNYRNKITMFVEKNNYLKLGNYLGNSNSFVFEENITIPETINTLIKDMNSYYKEHNIWLDYLNKVVFKVNEQKEIMIIFETNKDNIDSILYVPFLKKYNIVSVYNKNKKHYLLYKNQYLNFNINDINYLVGPDSFFQVNTSMVKNIYNLILQEVNKNSIVADCFSGISSISFYIKDNIKKSYSIEINKEACSIADHLINKNNIDNITIINGDFFKTINKYINKVNTVILDPPRGGLKKEVIEILNNNKLDKVIYLSCNLKTLCRDLIVLNKKYKIEKVIPIKNFFQTAECETLAVLKRKEGIK